MIFSFAILEEEPYLEPQEYLNVHDIFINRKADRLYAILSVCVSVCLYELSGHLTITGPQYRSTSLHQKRLYTSLGSSCPTCVHQIEADNQWFLLYPCFVMDFGVRILDRKNLNWCTSFFDVSQWDMRSECDLEVVCQWLYCKFSLTATERYQSQISHLSLQYSVLIVLLAPQHLGSPFINIGKRAFLDFARSADLRHAVWMWSRSHEVVCQQLCCIVFIVKVLFILLGLWMEQALSDGIP